MICYDTDRYEMIYLKVPLGTFLFTPASKKLKFEIIFYNSIKFKNKKA